MPVRLSAVQFFALLFSAISLVPAGAHLAEMPQKMQLAPDQYMIVQQVYAGWAWFGVPIVLGLIFMFWHMWLVRDRGIAFYWASAAFFAAALALGVFWGFTFPVNRMTANWTLIPADFSVARWQWEVSHAVAALVSLSAFVMLVFAILASRPAPAPARSSGEQQGSPGPAAGRSGAVGGH